MENIHGLYRDIQGYMEELGGGVIDKRMETNLAIVYALGTCPFPDIILPMPSNPKSYTLNPQLFPLITKCQTVTSRQVYVPKLA